MFNIGKTSHDSIGEAINDAQNDDTSNDCAHLEFDTGHASFTIQYLDPDEDGRDTVYNVTGMGSRNRLKQQVDLDVVDDGPGFIVFESGTASHDTARAEIEAIVAALNGTLNDVTATKAFTAGKPTVKGNLKSLLGME